MGTEDRCLEYHDSKMIVTCDPLSNKASQGCPLIFIVMVKAGPTNPMGRLLFSTTTVWFFLENIAHAETLELAFLQNP